MTRHRWFLPETPDVLGMLRAQTAITMEGMEALVAWSVGEPGAADRLRDCEHQADDCKRELRAALTIAFTTPLEPEDIFELSTELDRVLNSAKNTSPRGGGHGDRSGRGDLGNGSRARSGRARSQRGVRAARGRRTGGGDRSCRPRRDRARVESRRSTASRCRRWSRWTTCARSPRSGSSIGGSRARATISARSQSASGTRC